MADDVGISDISTVFVECDSPMTSTYLVQIK